MVAAVQQVLAYETDLLEYDDLFTGSVVVEKKVAEIVDGARAEMARVAELGGAVAAVESGYMKAGSSPRWPSAAGGWRAARTSSSV